MCWKRCIRLIFIVGLFSIFWTHTLATLIFPAGAVLQVTMSMSTPIYAPNHKMYFDWGFQMNYDLPRNITQLYQIPTWSGIFNKREARALDHWKYGFEDEVHPSDFTAGELYIAIEDLIIQYGFHETCLLKSVCELAKYPFQDDEQNLITEVITFILSPSMHEAFGRNEHVYKQAYEKAEELGFLGRDCDKIYSECSQDLIGLISKIMKKTFRI